MRRDAARCLALGAAAALAVLLAPPGAPRAEDLQTVFPAPAGERQTLVVRSATDMAAATPLIRGFQAREPDVTVRYFEEVTNALFETARAECAAGRSSADVLVTSSVDHLVVLANEGCASEHRSAETGRGPAWTRWRDEVFGFTFEPAVIVYNRAGMASAEVPHTRVALVDLLREQPERLKGRIGSYDIALSGIGYLFASLDGRNAFIYGRLIEGFGRTDVVTRCCSADLVKEIAEGRLLLGYNLLGSYAVTAQRAGAAIGIVVPEDYVLVLSRSAMIPASAPNRALAARFVDFLLSAEGQRIVRDEAFHFDFSGRLPEGVEGLQDLAAAGTLRPITVGPGLLPVQDKAKRDRFLRDWEKAVRTGAGRADPAPTRE